MCNIVSIVFEASILYILFAAHPYIGMYAVCAERDAQEREREARETVDRLTEEINELKKPDYYLYKERGDARMALGDFDRAFEDYSEAIKIKSFSRAPLFLLLQKRVTAAIESGKYRQALADSHGLTKVSPPQPDLFAILALILARSPDMKVKDAKASLDAAIYAANLDSPRKDVVLIERALAAAYSVNGDFKAAVAHQEKAVAAVKGEVPSDMKAQLDAYKAGKEYPFQVRKPK